MRISIILRWIRRIEQNRDVFSPIDIKTLDRSNRTLQKILLYVRYFKNKYFPWRNLLVNEISFPPKVFDVVRSIHLIVMKRHSPKPSLNQLRQEINHHIEDLIHISSLMEFSPKIVLTLHEFEMNQFHHCSGIFIWMMFEPSLLY